MAANPKPQWTMDVEEYLKLDDESTDVRYEYLDGHIYAMSGGTLDHSTIKINTTIALRMGFGSKGSCRVYDSDARVQISETRYVYPDATVTCETADMDGKSKTIRSPRVVIEVLSPGTEFRDRTKKLAVYQECPTIQEYVLVNYRYQCVEMYRRQGRQWIYLRFVPDEDVELKSLDISISFSDLYTLTDIPIEDEWEDDEPGKEENV